MSTVRVLLFPVGEDPRVVDIKPNMYVLQAMTGDPFQMVPLSDGCDLVCDDEGKLKGLQPNRLVPELQDIICGPFLIMRHDDEGESASITDEDCERWRRELG